MEIPIITNVTYSDLVNLIDSHQLNAGLQYRITDFRTRHYIVDADMTRYYGAGNEIVGDLEPLIVTATSSHTIDNYATSEQYPQDEICYDWNPDNWLDDLSFADSDVTSSIIIPGFTGVITFRYDTLLDNYLGYDFRNVKFRRWETQTSAWNVSTSYNKFDIVNFNNIVYKAINSSIGLQPNTNTTYWNPLLIIGTYTYWNASPTSSNGIPSSTVYADLKTFCETDSGSTYENCCRSNYFESFKDSYTYSEVTGTLLPNNVFFLGDLNYLTIYSNKIFPEFSLNTIGPGFFYNTIGTYFYYNMIGTTFASNTFGNLCTNNIIMNNFVFNNVSNHFIFNNISNNFSTNSLSNNVAFNVFGTGTIHNNIGTHCSYNIIGSGCSHNTTAAEFSGNTIGTGFLFNNFGNKASINVIGNLFQYNNIANDFTSNIIGDFFNYNSIESKFTNNVISTNFYFNTLDNDFNFNTSIGNNFRYNTGSCNHIDFALATHVYNDYSCGLLKRSDGAIKLQFVDALNTHIFVDPNV